MKDVGVAVVILGIKISKTLDVLVLSQSRYIGKILKKFNLYDCNHVGTPVDINLFSSKHKGEHITT